MDSPAGDDREFRMAAGAGFMASLDAVNQETLELLEEFVPVVQKLISSLEANGASRRTQLAMLCGMVFAAVLDE